MMLVYEYGATLASPGDPFDPTELTTKVTGPHGVTRHTYAGATRTLTITLTQLPGS